MGMFGDLFGTSFYEKQLGQMAGYQNKRMQNIQGQTDPFLMNLLQSGGKSAVFDANQRNAEGDMNAYYQQALAQLLRGMGDAPALQQTQGRLALARGRSADLSKVRQQNMFRQDDRVMQALAMLLGQGQGAMGGAMQGYGSAGQMALGAGGLYSDYLRSASGIGAGLG